MICALKQCICYVSYFNFNGDNGDYDNDDDYIDSDDGGYACDKLLW